MVPTISIRSLHLEYELWIREIAFYKEEICLFENHLEGLASQNSDPSRSVQIEHFQNQFILQKEVIDYLKHDLHVSEKQLAAFAHELSYTGLESIRMDNHTQLRERVITFRNIYGDLKKEFREFESRC